MPKVGDSIFDSLRRHQDILRVPKQPLWKGPDVDGITSSLLSRFLVCRERFRLLVIEGIKTKDVFNHKLEFGNMWHLCEERSALAGDWQGKLMDYSRALCMRYPHQQEEITKWYNVCKVQFPIYLSYWSAHPDVKDRVPMLQEEVFSVPYDLPSGRKVRLRGKFDSVDLIGKGESVGVWLQENKTKGHIIENQIRQQLTFDLQTCFYLIALKKLLAAIEDKWQRYAGIVRGVRYNVVRRPLSGGKGTIVRHKPTKKDPQGESESCFYGRVRDIIAASPQDYFLRMRVEVTAQDLDVFARQFLDPILEQLCDWWEWASTSNNNPEGECSPIHWRHPYGVYNVLLEGGSTDLDEHLASGSMVGLTRTDNLFPEL